MGSVADLAAIRRVLESMESSAHETEEHAAREELLSGQAVPDGDLAPCGWSSGTSRSALRQEVRAVPVRSMEGKWTQALEVYRRGIERRDRSSATCGELQRAGCDHR